LEQARAAFAHQAAQKSITLTTHVTPDLPEIRADELRLAQVLSNLISNALRFTPEGGQIMLGAKTTGKHVILFVQDTGAGIAPEDLPYVFERLYRVDKARNETEGESGSGLGLAIVKALVQAHGGTVKAQSEVRRGTTILLKLPAGETVQSQL
jgi:two-component system sensor histidine kinase ResE